MAKQLSHKDYRHNNKWMILDGVGWALGFELVNASSIVSVFLFTLTGSVTLSGLATTVQNTGMMLGQLSSGPKISKMVDGARTGGINSVYNRVLLLLGVLSILLPLPPKWTAIVMLTLLFFAWFFQGIVGMAWTDMYPRVIRRDHYGKVMGYRGLFGYIMAFLGGLYVKWILSSDTMELKTKYVLIMGVGVCFLSICILAMYMLKDLGPKNRKISHTIWEMIKDLPAKLQLPESRPFKKLMIVRVTAMLADAMLAFMMVFAASNGDLSESQVATLIFLKIIGALIASYFGGKLVDTLGSHIIMTAHFVLRIVLAALAIFLIFTPTAGWYLYIILVLLTGMSMQGMMAYSTYTMVVTPDHIRPDMLLVNTLLGLPFALLPMALGWLADTVGFLPLFIGMMVFSIVATILSKVLLLNKKEQDAFMKVSW